MLCQQTLLSLEKLRFHYDPFPIGFADETLDHEFYDRLLATWPADHLFEHKPDLGNKYSLSEVNHPDIYEAYIQQFEPWRQLYQWIKSTTFIASTLETLRQHNIDVGFCPEQLSARFEFSMMSAQGGYIRPHTDAPHKTITLVVYMPRPGEWDPAFGGGTSMLRPKDIRRNYNHMNIPVGFDEVECLHTFPYEPNACTLFIKTFNSYHAVFPMQGPADIMRRSLTINIEDKHDPRLVYVRKNPARRGFALR